MAVHVFARMTSCIFISNIGGGLYHHLLWDLRYPPWALRYSSVTAPATAPLQLRFTSVTASSQLPLEFLTAPLQLRCTCVTAPLHLRYSSLTSSVGAALQLHCTSATASVAAQLYSSVAVPLQVRYPVAALRCSLPIWLRYSSSTNPLQLRSFPLQFLLYKPRYRRASLS